MSNTSYMPALLAPEFSTHNVDSFYEHVSALKRIPKRTGAKKPLKLKALKGKLMAKAHVYELSCGSTMYPVNFTAHKVARKTQKHIRRAEILNASRMLIQPEGAVVAFLEKKHFIIEAGES